MNSLHLEPDNFYNDSKKFLCDHRLNDMEKLLQDLISCFRIQSSKLEKIESQLSNYECRLKQFRNDV